MATQIAEHATDESLTSREIDVLRLSVFTQASPLASNGLSGSNLASLLLGYPAGGSQDVVSSFDDFFRYYAGFVQDDYRITPKLTLNLGLRFKHESGLQEANNKIITGFNTVMASHLSQNGFPVTGGVEYAGVGGNPTQTGKPLSAKPGPRIGLAYALDSETVIRGGYGIFWARTSFNYQNAIGTRKALRSSNIAAVAGPQNTYNLQQMESFPRRMFLAISRARGPRWSSSLRRTTALWLSS